MHETRHHDSQRKIDCAKSHNFALGARGENLAVEYLRAHGFTIIARNWRFGRIGELDIVAADGQTLVAVEVKTRTGNTHGSALEAITPLKAHRLRILLYQWLRNNPAQYFSLRIDAVAITLLKGEEPNIQHVRGIS